MENQLNEVRNPAQAADTNKSGDSSSKPGDFKPGKSKGDDSKPSKSKRAYSIADSVSSLMNSKDLSDVTFIVGVKKKLIYGHKTILSLGSPVFRQMFFGEFPQTSEGIEIDDLTETGFKNMLAYIYSNKIDFDLSTVYETYKSLDKYLVHDFQERLLAHIENNLDKSNCTLIFDQLLKIEKENVCLDLVESFIKVNASAAFCSDSFLQIDRHSLIRLLNFDYLNMSEFDILSACSRWVQAKLKKSNKPQTRENFQKELKEIKNLINFADLTVDELSKIGQHGLKNILSFSEMGSLFFHRYDKTTKPKIEYQASRKTMHPFVVEDSGVFYRDHPRDSFGTRRFASTRKILVSALFTFIDSENEKAQLSITDEKTKEQIKLKITKDVCESKLVFHFDPYFEVETQKAYLLKFTSGPSCSTMVASKNTFEYKGAGTDYNVKIYLTALNDYYCDDTCHFVRKIQFFDCS